MNVLGKIRLTAGMVALCLAGFQIPCAQAVTWTFTPELRRLDAEGNELPAGRMDIDRDELLRVGLYVNVESDSTAPANDAVLGFESFIGAIHFSSGEMGLGDIAPVVRALRGGYGWERRMTNTSFEPAADRWLGPAEESEDETSWISFWSDAANVQDELRGAWCAADDGSCRIFVGVLDIPVGEMPPDAVGSLSLRLGSVTSPEEPAIVASMLGRAEENVVNGNTITYSICPASGCASAADKNEAPDRESRALAMKYALAGFGREVGGNVIDMIGQRAAMKNAGLDEAYASIGGRALDLAALGFGEGDGGGLSGWVGGALDLVGIDPDSRHGLAWEAARVTGISSGRLNPDLLPDVRDLLRGSAFEMPLGGTGNGAPGRWTLWGVGGDMDAFRGQPEDRFSMDGEVFAGHVGLDYRVNDAVLAGTILSHSNGQADYRFSGPAGDGGRIRMQLASAHPYVHWTPGSGLSVWGSVGFGRGDAVLADEKGDAETDIEMRMLAAGSRRELMSVGRVDLAVKADAFLVQMQSGEHEYLPGVAADTSRVRLALEGSRSFAFGNGSALTGSLELGGRADGGDAETGAGAELGAALAYMHPAGLDIQARGHVLLVHEDSKFEQWGASLTVNFDMGTRGEGLFFAFAPTWGAPATGAEGMWSSTRAAQALLGTGNANQGMNLDSRVGYGHNLPGGQGKLTLFSEMGQAHGGSAHLRLGTQLGQLRTNGSRLDFELYGERISPIRDEGPAYGILLNARGRF